jgi:hypothetical protein
MRGNETLLRLFYGICTLRVSITNSNRPAHHAIHHTHYAIHHTHYAIRYDSPSFHTLYGSSLHKHTHRDTYHNPSHHSRAQ